MNLFSQLFDSELLLIAWQHVRDKKAGGGIDKQSVAQFGLEAEQFLAELSDLLRKGEYIPEPYLEIRIPKDENDFRILGLPTVRDKIVQQAVKMLIEPLLEPVFVNTSYGYRPNKGAYKAIQRVKHCISEERCTFVLQCDIDQYFDNISHKSVLKRLQKIVSDEKILELISLWIRMAKVGNALTWQATEKGLPQGNVLSPILSNLYLHDFDVFIRNKKFGYVRYADDFVVLTHSRKQATEAHAQIETFLKNNLALTLNPEFQIRHVSEGFEFLGLKILGSDVFVTEEKRQKLFHKAADTFRLTPKGELETEFLATLRSIGSYYGKLLPQHFLEEIDTHTRNALVEACRNALKQKKIHRNQLNLAYFEDLAFCSEKWKNEKSEILALIVKQIRSRGEKKILRLKPEVSQKEAETMAKIEKKRKEYQQKAAEARELLLSQSGFLVGKSKGKVVVKQDRKTLHEIPFQHLDNITIQANGILLSSDLIAACAEHRINIQLLDFEGNPYAYIMYNAGLSAEIGLAQLESYRNGKAEYMAIRFVEGKIRNQVTLIKYFSKSANTEAAAVATEAMLNILAEIEKLPDLPLKALSEQLFSIEGRAAAYYWEFIKIHLRGYAEFGGRERQGAQDPVNSALNYGYGILYGRTFEAVARAKLHPSLSYLHTPSDTGIPTLTFDLIEEFRAQAVDKPIMGMIRKEFVPVIEKDGRLDDESRKRIAVKVLERLGKYEHFRGQELRLHDIMMTQARNLAKFLKGEIKHYQPYLGKW